MRFKLFRHFGVREEGVAAIEFALIFPVIIATMAGAWDYSTAGKVERNLKRASASVAQIVTRGTAFDATAQDEINKGLAAILGEAGQQGYRVRVDGFVNDGGSFTREWTWGATDVPQPDPIKYLKNTLSDGRGGVIVRVEQDYASLFTPGEGGGLKLSATHASGALNSTRVLFSTLPAPGTAPVSLPAASPPLEPAVQVSFPLSTNIPPQEPEIMTLDLPFRDSPLTIIRRDGGGGRSWWDFFW